MVINQIEVTKRGRMGIIWTPGNVGEPE